MSNNRPTNADQYTAFCRGVFSGASHQLMDARLEKHLDETIREAYLDGWAQGRAVVNKICRDAEKTYGYSPSVIRALDNDPAEEPTC